MLVTMEMAKLVLDAGFTAGAAPPPPSRGSTWSPSAINEGRFPGPRYLAASPEITTVGGLGDASLSHIPHRGSTSASSSPARRRCAARCACSSSTASTRSSSTSRARRSPAWAPKRRRCRTRRSRWRRRRRKLPQQGARRACPLVGLGQAVRPPRHRDHLPRLLRRRGGARHARGGQGPALRRARHRLADQHRAPCRAMGHQARLDGRDATTSASSKCASRP